MLRPRGQKEASAPCPEQPRWRRGPSSIGLSLRLPPASCPSSAAGRGRGWNCPPPFSFLSPTTKQPPHGVSCLPEPHLTPMCPSVRVPGARKMLTPSPSAREHTRPQTCVLAGSAQGSGMPTCAARQVTMKGRPKQGNRWRRRCCVRGPPRHRTYWDPKEVDQKLCLATRSQERRLMEFAPAVPRTLTQGGGAGAGGGRGPSGRSVTCPASLWPAPRCFHDGMETVLHFSEPSGI